jgi:hypothetical protein
MTGARGPHTALIVFGALALVLVGSVLLTYQFLTRPFPGHNDFLTPWEASRLYFYEGLDPYSDAVSLRIQERIFGRAALPDEQPNHFAYPLYAILFVWPVIHMDYAWASAIWMVAMEAALIGGLIALLALYRWRARPITVAGLALFMLIVYPGARGLLLGQVSHLVFTLQALALLALSRRRDRLAGVLLALATFKPQMVYLLVPPLLAWGLVTGRRAFVTAFAVTLGALVAVSFALLPDWLAGFWHQLTLYPTYIEVSTPAWVIADRVIDAALPGAGRPAELILNALGLTLVAWVWFDALARGHRERVGWAVMLTLTMTHLIGLRTATPHFIVFAIPLVFHLRGLAQRRGAALFGLLAALIALPWAHFLLTLGAGKFEDPSLFVPLPLLTLAVVWLTRRRWWAASSLLG